MSNHHVSQNEQERLTQAFDTIKLQEQQIAVLQQQLQREHFAQELRQLIAGLSAVNVILSPFTYTRLLEMVVQAAAKVISARAGSLFLIDEQTQELLFEVAIGPVAHSVKKFRVPLGHGIVGLVALTGQPMAIAHAQQDERLAIDIASAVNYIPESVLCVPLFYEDRVIGALELLDKTDEPAFRSEDIGVLGMFSNIAAIAIAQSRAFHDQQSLLHTLVRSFAEENPEQKQQLYQEATTFAQWMNSEDPINTRARKLAMLVHELALDGEQESEMCSNILQGFVANARNRKKAYSLAGR